MGVFYIPNLSVTIATKFSSDKGESNYIKEIQQGVATNTMIIFFDGLSQVNPGSTGSGVVTKNPDHHR